MGKRTTASSPTTKPAAATGSAVGRGPQPATRPARRCRSWIAAGIGVIAIALVAGGVAADYWTALPPDTVATFVGRQACVQCHQEQAAAFRNSDHDRAMDVATEESVLGDFENATLEHHGIHSRMYRDGDRFMVHTEGPDGEMGDFEIKYVFGVRPLQQYMVEFDRDEHTPQDAIARLQVLRISWDTENERWFHLDPPDVSGLVAPDDPMHWTGITQRWNTMCAECHSTNVQKNFDLASLKYHTTFSEIDVSCEACHGPGSTHVALAESLSLFWDRNLGYGLVDLRNEDHHAEIGACAPCHSRRDTLAEGFTAGDEYCDFYSPSLLSPGLYHADGQIEDEVFVYGSFAQSKMYHKGIRCSDCHDPHSLRLKAPGNQVCTSCHQHPAGKYDTPAHHKHPPGSAGASCVECHMPHRTYMALDQRRDHSLRIPRPDLSVALGTPNACTGCHLDSQNVSPEKREQLVEYADWQRLAREGDEEIRAEIARVDAWCDAACDEWYGDLRQRPPHFAEALTKGRSGAAEAIEPLAALAGDLATPAIVRATALDELAARGEASQLAQRVRAGRDALDDPEPMVRAAAIGAVAGEVYGQRGLQRLAEHLAPMLEDPSRLVRSTAAQTLAMSGAARELPIRAHQQFLRAIEEIQRGNEATNDRSGTHMRWGLLCEALGRVDEAVAAYEMAIRVEPNTPGPRSNMAMLLERTAQTQATVERVETLRREELELLEQDAERAPELAPLRYRIAAMHYTLGDLEKSMASIRRAVELAPENELYREFLSELSRLMESQ